MRALIVTLIPSPYQVELFDALAARHAVEPRVLYVLRRWPSREWTDPTKQHEYAYLDDPVLDSEAILQWADDADLVVLADYRSPWSRRLIARCVARGQPWCFWGERPGARRTGWLGVWYRRWRLRALQRSRAPIWGMGGWAVERYRHEFGDRRPYFNVPYYSDLARFHRSTARDPFRVGRRFLFSGSLIERKGVDLLAEAFAELAPHRPDDTLTFVGSGPLEPALRKRLAAFGERVRFLGFCPWADLPRVYHEADVLCVPSRYDGWGLVVPEGLAAGLPVVATNRMGAAIDLIRPGENGWVCRAGEQSSLTVALRQAAELSSDDLARMSMAAQESVARHTLAEGATNFEAAAQKSLDWWRNSALVSER